MSLELRAILTEKAIDALYEYVASQKGNAVVLSAERIRKILEGVGIKLREKEFRRLLNHLRYILEECRISDLAEPKVKVMYKRIYVVYPNRFWVYRRECVMSALVALKNDPDSYGEIALLVYVPRTGTEIVSVWVEKEVWEALRAIYPHLSQGQIIRLALYRFLDKWREFLKIYDRVRSSLLAQEVNRPSA